MKPHEFHPEARLEYIEATTHYQGKSSGLGNRFHEEIFRLIAEIRRAPSLYRHIDGPFQRHFSTTFPYAVIYVQEPERIHIIAVMHMHRRPGYWKHRVV